MIVQPNKAIVGANAFAHESGIHQVCKAIGNGSPAIQRLLYVLLLLLLLLLQGVALHVSVVGRFHTHARELRQDGVLKNPLTYEIMTPESVGLKNTNLVLGKLSGRAAFQDRMKELGFELCAYM